MGRNLENFQVGAVVVLTSLFMATAPAQAVRLSHFSKGPIVVRLCPVKCVEVAGHGFRRGKEVAVFETRKGWARVSAFIDPEKLRRTFGNKVPPKPAYWVPLRSIAKAGKDKRAADPFASEAAALESKKTTVNPEKLVPAETEKKKKPKKAAQKRRVTVPVFRPGTVYQVADEEQKTEKEIVETAMVEPKAEEPTVASTAMEKPKAMVKAEPKAKVEAMAVEKMEPKPVVEEPVKPEPVVAKVEKMEAAAKSPPKKKFVYRIPKAEEEATTVAAAKPVSDDKPVVKKVVESKAVEPAVEKQKTEVEVAKIEPPKEVKPADSAEPTFESADVDPLVTEARPKTYVKALNDKRLKKLPGRKSKLYKPEEVIALRHQALMLLNNKECNGIVRGGRSSGTEGMMYIICSEDPTYQHLFPLEEQSW